MFYQETRFKKNQDGNWVKKSSKPIQCNMPYGKWVQSANLDKKNGDKTYLISTPTKTGLNMKVTSATTYFADGKEKVKYDLITTANKLPQSYFDKKGIKNTNFKF